MLTQNFHWPPSKPTFSQFLSKDYYRPVANQRVSSEGLIHCTAGQTVRLNADHWQQTTITVQQSTTLAVFCVLCGDDHCFRVDTVEWKRACQSSKNSTVGENKHLQTIRVGASWREQFWTGGFGKMGWNGIKGGFFLFTRDVSWMSMCEKQDT